MTDWIKISGHIKIFEEIQSKARRLIVDVDNIILISALKQLPRLVSPTPPWPPFLSAGRPITHCVIGKTGGVFVKTDVALRAQIPTINGGKVTPNNYDITLENYTSVEFIYRLNESDVLYSYLHSQVPPDPKIKEIGMVINDTDNLLFCAHDLEGSGDDFNVVSNVIYIVQYQIKFDPGP